MSLPAARDAAGPELAPNPLADAPALRLLLVDDEPLARLRLRQLLAQRDMPPVQVLGEAGDARELAILMQQLAADGQAVEALLLDIGLPGRDGLQIAQLLRGELSAEPARAGGSAVPAPPQVVFITAHAGHALQAFELAALDYLTKPVRAERLRETLLRLLARRSGAETAGAAPAPPVLVLPERGGLRRLPVSEVLYCKAELKYVTVVSAKGQWLLDEALSELEQRLGPGFVRVHRNALVAVAAVRALEDSGDGAERWCVRLGNGERLAVSRRQLAGVRAALGFRA